MARSGHFHFGPCVCLQSLCSSSLDINLGSVFICMIPNAQILNKSGNCPYPGQTCRRRRPRAPGSNVLPPKQRLRRKNRLSPEISWAVDEQCNKRGKTISKQTRMTHSRGKRDQEHNQKEEKHTTHISKKQREEQ